MQDTFTNKKPKKTSRTFSELVNTPFKKALFGVQILSYILIMGSPAIGAISAKWMDLTGSKTGALIVGIFLTGEILFYASLAFLGKELIMVLKDKFKTWLKPTKESKMEINNEGSN
jgi:hypothetical protein